MIKRKTVKHKTPIPKGVATKYPPLTSENQLQKTRKEQNALNRARSKSMENRVAKVLGGRRVLMSGAAAAYKGDVEVRFDNFPSGYIVECKLSAQTKDKDAYILLHFAWFPKMQEEAKNMGSKFAVLIVNFLGSTRDYVFVRKDIVEKIIHKYDSPYAPQLTRLLNETELIDIRTTKGGKPLKASTLHRSAMEASMKKVDGIAGVRYIVPDGEYLVLHIDAWASAVEHM